MEEQAQKRKYKKSTIISGTVTKVADLSTHYVDRQKFYEALVERKAAIVLARNSDGVYPRISEFIGKCILDIATGIARKYQFSSYSFKDEMISDAIIHCLKYIDSFNPEKSTNPFAYYSQACYYLFLERIKLEKQEQYVKYKQMLDSSSLNEFSETQDEYTMYNLDTSEMDTSHMSDFVSNFEKAVQRQMDKKPKRKTMGTTLDDFGTTELNEFVVEEKKNTDEEFLVDVVEQMQELVD